MKIKEIEDLCEAIYYDLIVYINSKEEASWEFCPVEVNSYGDDGVVLKSIVFNNGIKKLMKRLQTRKETKKVWIDYSK